LISNFLGLVRYERHPRANGEVEREPAATPPAQPEVDDGAFRLLFADHTGHIAAGFLRIPNLISEQASFVGIMKPYIALGIRAFADHGSLPSKKMNCSFYRSKPKRWQ
jgi:hypothetical protein